MFTMNFKNELNNFYSNFIQRRCYSIYISAKSSVVDLYFMYVILFCVRKISC